MKVTNATDQCQCFKNSITGEVIIKCDKCKKKEKEGENKKK